MAQANDHRRRSRPGWLGLLVLAAGCGNPGEGTVTVAPEARARLRGKPAAVAPVAAKPGAKKQVNVKELMRRKPEG